MNLRTGAIVHRNSRLLFRKYARDYFQSDSRVLEIGPDRIPSTYQRIVGDRSITWDTLDIADDPKLTYSAAGEYSFPVPDGAYDIVLSGQVLEHVRKIWVWIKEVARVCRDGGHVIIINPVSWPYHEAPVDCWRAFPDGMRALYDEAGLEVILSTVESLEAPDYPNTIPGKSPTHQGWRRLVAYWLLGKQGWPVERAYDTITIGRKPGQREESESSVREASAG